MLHGPDESGINDMSIADIFYEMIALQQIDRHANIAAMTACSWDWTKLNSVIRNDVLGDITFAGPQYYYMVQELCQGGTLQSWIYCGDREPVVPNPLGFGSSALLRVAMEMFSAIAHLRKFGFVHCDLKPDNCGMMCSPAEFMTVSQEGVGTTPQCVASSHQPDHS